MLSDPDARAVDLVKGTVVLVAPGGEPVQLTDLGEPVSGRFVPGSDRILLAFDEGGNERVQLYLLDARRRRSRAT